MFFGNLLQSKSRFSSYKLIFQVYGLLTDRSRKRIKKIAPIFVLLGLMDFIGVIFLASCGTLAYNLISGDSRPSRIEQALRQVIKIDVSSSTLILIFAITAGLFLISKTLLSALVNFRMIKWLANQESQFSMNLFSSLLNAPLAQIKRIGIGEAQWAIMIGSSRIVSGVLAPIVTVLGDVISIAILITTLLVATPSVTIILILLLLVSQRLYSWWVKGRVRSYGLQTADKGSRLNDEIIQSFNAVKEIKIYNLSKEIQQYFAQERNTISIVGQKSAFLNSLFRYYLESIILFSAFFVVVFELINSDLRRALTSLVLFMSVGLRIIPSLQRLQAITMSLEYSQGMTKTFFKMHELLKNLNYDRGNLFGHSGVTKPLGIELNEVSFQIETEVGTDEILRSVSFRIEPGEFIAIIGSSGSGKTTLIDLIATLLSVNSGSISYFTDKEQWVQPDRGLIAYCSQTPYIFDTTIEHNLAISMSSLDSEEIAASIKTFDLENLVGHSAENNGTSLSRRVSGGERQRIGLARVFLAKRPLMIFDEPTSALDRVNSEKFLRLIESNRRSATQIVVTHDHEIAKKADKLMVIEKGNLEYFGVPHLYFARPSTVHE